MINSLILRISSLHYYFGVGFLNFPTWYEFLPVNSTNSPEFTGINDVWLIVAAIIDILLRIAAIIAIVVVIYGGIEFITSSGEPEKAAAARSRIINALIGLVIAVTAATMVAFIASRFNAS